MSFVLPDFGCASTRIGTLFATYLCAAGRICNKGMFSRHEPELRLLLLLPGPHNSLRSRASSQSANLRSLTTELWFEECGIPKDLLRRLNTNAGRTWGDKYKRALQTPRYYHPRLQRRFFSSVDRAGSRIRIEFVLLLEPSMSFLVLSESVRLSFIPGDDDRIVWNKPKPPLARPHSVISAAYGCKAPRLLFAHP